MGGIKGDIGINPNRLLPGVEAWRRIPQGTERTEVARDSITKYEDRASVWVVEVPWLYGIYDMRLLSLPDRQHNLGITGGRLCLSCPLSFARKLDQADQRGSSFDV